MGKFWKYYASYSIWSQTSPPIGKEHWHCDRKRGYSRARKKEPLIKELATTDNTSQKIGHLSQRAVYEFHQNIELLSQSEGREKVAEILQLENQLPEVKTRVNRVISNYHSNPILLNKNIVELKRGDEGFSDAIPIQYGNFIFGLYAAFDCVLLELDNRIHLLDFKTGKSNFDLRQAYVYIVAAQHIYPDKKVVASFYNLETQVRSELISMSSAVIESICIELSLVSQKLQTDLQRYRENPQLFERIFPANPGSCCKYCNFNSICEYATTQFPNDK